MPILRKSKPLSPIRTDSLFSTLYCCTFFVLLLLRILILGKSGTFPLSGQIIYPQQFSGVYFATSFFFSSTYSSACLSLKKVYPFPLFGRLFIFNIFLVYTSHPPSLRMLILGKSGTFFPFGTDLLFATFFRNTFFIVLLLLLHRMYGLEKNAFFSPFSEGPLL